MSYKKKRSPIYSVQRLPALNQNFRTVWQQGVDKAMLKVEELKNQGWNVDVERGALTAKQADFFVKVAEKMGHQTLRVPIADWDDKLVQFVAYKPKLGKADLPAAEPASKPKPKKDPVKEFQILFWGEKQPDEPDNGFLMAPDHTMALITTDANPSDPQHQKLVNFRNEVMSKAETNINLHYKDLLKAERKPNHYVYIKFGDFEFTIEKMKKAMRTLGKKGCRTHHYSKQGILAVSNPEKDVVIIAAATSSQPSQVVDHKRFIAGFS
jgi:hypothetical protein